ncbi:metal transporter CNNM4-like protein [Leptotrombidium deliense]|uniref:Metal transporter CNNM4-like protein n=1 Tax=Leptotrombidium deliense TaxID=299467 RepID=A0A443SCU8_9ACAR|nr:metal transporter CNNM4-like protein [Leptotrombidium deliense]
MDYEDNITMVTTAISVPIENQRKQPSIIILQPQSSETDFDDEISVIHATKKTEIFIFGNADNTSILFTRTGGEKNFPCDRIDRTKAYDPKMVERGVYSIEVTLIEFNTKYYICLLQSTQWLHQGIDPNLTIRTETEPTPLEWKIILIVSLLMLSALFSGLTIGLMTLDTNDLQVLALKGNEDQRRHAQTILPVRRHGNYLLCSLLLGNVLINAILTIQLDEMFSGVVAVICSTALIVLIGEIIPQAICSRHGLVVGAKTIYFTYALMIVTFPIALPISVFLDCLLGKEVRHIYDREKLREYIQITRPYHKLAEDEVNIITGILALSKKTVGDVMTKLDDVYMVPSNAKLDSRLISDIRSHGFSRIPVYDKQKDNIVALLYAKDIILFTDDDTASVEKVVKATKHPLIFTTKEKRIKTVLDQLNSEKCHMALVKASDGKAIGLITMEDIHEEILQSEILDEKDVVIDNKKKDMKKGTQTDDDFATFLNVGEERSVDTRQVSPQLLYSLFKFLAIEVKPFTSQFISRNVLRRLVEQKVYCENKAIEAQTLYSAGTVTDFFIIILEGRANLFIGKEQLQFECSSLAYFATNVLEINKEQWKRIGKTSFEKLNAKQAFTKPTFIADFTLKVAKEDTCLYMKITRTMYLAAVKATIFEKQMVKKKRATTKEIDSILAKGLDPKAVLGKLWVKTHKLRPKNNNSPTQRKNISKASVVSKVSIKPTKK